MLASQTHAEFVGEMVAVLLQQMVRVSLVLSSHLRDDLLNLVRREICFPKRYVLPVHHCTALTPYVNLWPLTISFFHPLPLFSGLRLQPPCCRYQTKQSMEVRTG